MSDTTMRPSENLRAQLRGLSIKLSDRIDRGTADQDFAFEGACIDCHRKAVRSLREAYENTAQVGERYLAWMRERAS